MNGNGCFKMTRFSKILLLNQQITPASDSCVPALSFEKSLMAFVPTGEVTSSALSAQSLARVAVRD